MKEKKIDVHIFFYPFLCSGIPDLAFGILKMLICVCFRDVLQPAVCSWHDMTLSQFYSKCTVYLCYLQVLAIYKKSIMDKSVFLYWWFSFDL